MWMYAHSSADFYNLKETEKEKTGVTVQLFATKIQATCSRKS